ncbi:hypothetical protein FV218_20210 [Methylobacterium sp. WL69]|nr:hypothetical protein FV218_20210 [Methylobacterium sp. WL69]
MCECRSLPGEGGGEVCELSGESTTLTPTLSQTGEGARRGSPAIALSQGGEERALPGKTLDV